MFLAMTFEVRVALLLLLSALWALIGFLSWTVAAVARRGRGVLLALPLAVAGAAAAGALVPVAGLRDELGFFLSLGTAFLGGALASLLGILLTARLSAR